MYKIVTNKNLLCSTENSMQYFVMAQVRKESKRRSSLFEWEIEADAWSWLSESSIKLCVTGTHSLLGRTSENTQISLSVLPRLLLMLQFSQTQPELRVKEGTLVSCVWVSCIPGQWAEESSVWEWGLNALHHIHWWRMVLLLKQPKIQLYPASLRQLHRHL